MEMLVIESTVGKAVMLLACSCSGGWDCEETSTGGKETECMALDEGGG